MTFGLLPAFRQKKAPTAPQGALSTVSELMPLMQALSEKA